MGEIYKPAGKAAEYSPLALNLFNGCVHGCKYCYAPAAARRKAADYHTRVFPYLDVLKNVRRDVKNLDGSQNVLLCFMGDAYQPVAEVMELAHQCIEVIIAAGVPVTVLTKGGMRAARDFDLLAKNQKSEFAATLTFNDPAESLKWEPGAALPADRLKALKTAHDMGIKTWVSFEPVIDPAAVMRLIRDTSRFVDLVKVGKWNYDRGAAAIDWAAFREEVKFLLDGLGKPYIPKRDLLAA